MAYINYANPGTPVETPLWRALLAAEQPRTIRELHQDCGAAPNAIQHRLSRWRKAGLVMRIDGQPIRFAVAPKIANDPEPPLVPPHVDVEGRITMRQPTASDRLWIAMRVMKRFDLPQLMLTAGCHRRSAETMINWLMRAGYLRREARGSHMRGTWSVYVLVRNTGRRTPIITRRVIDNRAVRVVIDRNTQAMHVITPRRASNPADVGGVS